MLTGASFFGSCGTSTRKPLDRLRGAQFVREPRTRKRLGARAGRPLPAVGRQPRETNWPGAPQVRRAPSSSLALWRRCPGAASMAHAAARPGPGRAGRPREPWACGAFDSRLAGPARQRGSEVCSWSSSTSRFRWPYQSSANAEANPAAAPARDRRRECEQRDQEEGRAGVVAAVGAGPSLSHRNGYARR
jgi:hypothetical protein